MMVMTNYMDLLAMHQPWNLILFMVLPVVLAESLVATEFYVTYYRKEGAGNWKNGTTGWALLPGLFPPGFPLPDDQCGTGTQLEGLDG